MTARAISDPGGGMVAPEPPSCNVQQHLHGGEIAGMTGAVDLHDQPRHAREVARAFLDELHLRKLRERDGVRDRDVGAGARIEIERDRQFGLAADRLEIGDRGRPASADRRTAAAARATAPRRRQALGIVRELDRGLERGVRDPDHHRHALVDEFDGAADQVLALREAEIGVFLGLDAGGDHHGGAAVLHHVVDLAGEAGFVDLEVGGERGERRNDQSWNVHWILHKALPRHSGTARSADPRSRCTLRTGIWLPGSHLRRVPG